MVEQSCIPPYNHLGDFDFDCSNVKCHYGPGGLRSKLLLLINICLNIYCGDNVTKLSPVPAAHWTAPVNNRWAPLSELLPL